MGCSRFFLAHEVYLADLALLKALLSDYFLQDVVGKMVFNDWGWRLVDFLDVAIDCVAFRSDVLEKVIDVFLGGRLRICLRAFDVHEDDGFSLT